MGKPTPGPWAYRPAPHDDWGVVRAGRFWICQAKDPNVYTEDQLAAHRAAKTDPWEANARLIAAAPDFVDASPRAIKMMQLAAKHIREWAPVETIAYDGTDCDGYCLADDLERAAEMLAAALARALPNPDTEGQQA